MQTRLKVERVFNNNVVLGTITAPPPAPSQTVVALAKGIGFGARRGSEVDAAGAQIFVSQPQGPSPQLASLLNDVPFPQVQVASRIMELARSELGLTPSAALMLPILDHLTFAVQRVEQGIEVDFPLAWEVAQLYPRETAFGRAAVELAQSHLGVVFQAGEWSAFALHAINQSLAGGDISRTVAMTRTISATFDALEKTWGQAINREGVAAARFITHLRYLFVRLTNDNQLQETPFDVLAAMESTHPEATAAARQVGERIGQDLRHELSDGEVGYLALHIARLQLEM